jgi:hypothetical protein
MRCISSRVLAPVAAARVLAVSLRSWKWRSSSPTARRAFAHLIEKFPRRSMAPLGPQKTRPSMPGWAKRARCSSSIGCRRPLPQGTSVAGHSPVAPTNSWSSLPPALRVDPMRTRSESPVPMLRTRSTRRCAARLDVVIERRPARTRASYRCSTVRGSMAARARGGATMKRGRYFTIPQAVEAYPGVLTERLIRRLVAQRRIAFRLRRPARGAGRSRHRGLPRRQPPRATWRPYRRGITSPPSPATRPPLGRPWVSIGLSQDLYPVIPV